MECIFLNFVLGFCTKIYQPNSHLIKIKHDMHFTGRLVYIYVIGVYVGARHCIL